uniref:Uncharacterized protein n=1 Tax=Rhizophora mucronata TaxID=61149 RepID=A0A2P2QUP5_RHIMU
MLFGHKLKCETLEISGMTVVCISLS